MRRHPSMGKRDCPGCQLGWRAPRQYLCKRCWFQLPAETRRLLWLRDDLIQARGRLRGLYLAIHQGVMLPDITPAVLLANMEGGETAT